MAHRRTALKCTSCDQPTAGDTGALCWDCTKTGVRDLASWALWDRNLEITRTRRDRIRRGTDGPAGHHSDETPLPVNLHAAHIAGRHRTILTDWHRRLRTAIPLDHDLPAWPVCKAAVTTWCTHPSCRRIYLDHGNAPATNTDMALALAAASAWWRHEPDAADLIHAAHRAVHDIRAAADIPPPMVTLGRCDTEDCNAELRAPKGNDWVQCQPCGTSYDVNERRTLLLNRIDSLRTTAPVIARVLSDLTSKTLNPDDIHQWHRRRGADGRPRLERAGTDPITGQPLWRFGDVRELHQQAIMNKIKGEAAKAVKAEREAACQTA